MIYVHIPFCARKCNYCAFYSKVGGADEISAYVDALTAEIKIRATGEKFSTIYFGGGTPSLLTISQLEKILSAINLSGAVEITLEANPGTVDEKYLRDLRAIGFNRLSLGVQTFNNELLRILGRIHDKNAALATIYAAKKFFDNVSVDLMYGLPGQSFVDVENDLEFVVAQEVQHISIYGLEIEAGTKFGELYSAGKLQLPDGGDMYDLITATLPRFGYRRYEISNFARAGYESRHNLGYWTGKKYLGVGAGAHSYDGKIRTANIADVATYVKKIRAGEDVSEIEEIVTRQAAMEEFCFLGLRIAEGISAETFAEKFGEDIFSVYGRVIKKNIALGLLESSGGRIYLTSRGMKFGNVVFADFLLD
ncbi:MAG: radical SAM family heme chaperone HemW [Selenomonadaceae bacterium]|nr:radical SAM family heme chaperone HemW [Selenomonadaceae bacterium]